MTAIQLDQSDQLIDVVVPADPAPIVDVSEDGVYEDLPEEQYHGQRESLSSSGARMLLPPSCPALFRHEQIHGRPPKRTFDFGHAAHQRVLGVGAELVVVEKKAGVDATDRRTAYAQVHEKEIRAKGGIPVLRKELDVVDAMAAAILEHPIASILFDPDRGGKPEQSLFWMDPAFGVRRRARLDWLPTEPTSAGRLVISDYKTTVSAAPRAFAKSVFEYGYHCQADWYMELARALGLADDPAFVFVAQQKTAPFLVTVHECDPMALRIARTLNERALDVYAECVATDTWPGYSDDIELVSPPSWLAREFEDLVL